MLPRPRLTRSDDRRIAGVCGGIAEFLGWTPASVRALALFALIFSAVIPAIVVYAVLAWMMPPANHGQFRLDDFHG